MDVGTISLVLLVGMFVLLAIGMPLGFASGFLATVVMILKFEPTLFTDPFVHGLDVDSWKMGEGTLTRRFGTGPMGILGQKLYGITTNYVLISVPLFIFMAALLERSGIAKDMYTSFSIWLSRVRGGVAVVTSLMAVVMAAMSGIIGGEVVLLGLIALPQMLRLGYNQNLAIGTICASGSLGTMIPPSIVLIFYGLITETSVSLLFKAAFLPGFMLASLYIIYIFVRTHLNPSLAPLPKPLDDDMSPSEMRFYGKIIAIESIGAVGVFFALRYLILSSETIQNPDTASDPYHLYVGGLVFLASAVVLIFQFGIQAIKDTWYHTKGIIQPIGIVFIILGSIYGGVTSITEAAAMGVFTVFVLIILRGEFSFDVLKEASMRTFKSTGTIIWVTFGAAALSGAYTIVGGPTYVANLILGYDFPTMGIILIMMVVFLILGAFMDWTGIVLLVMPVFLPILLQLPMHELGLTAGLDSRIMVQVWFGILFCVNMQVSFLSPPFGPAAFYLKSVAPPHITLVDIFKGFLPFIGMQLIVLTTILFVPQIVTVFL